MKKTCLTDPLRTFATYLLYILATMATLVSDSPTVVIILALMVLVVSLASWWLTDTAIGISELNGNQILLKTGRGRWIPVEITAIYYSGLGQVMVCHSLSQGVSWRRTRKRYLLAAFLPHEKRRSELRQQRCLGLTHLSDSMSTARFSGR